MREDAKIAIIGLDSIPPEMMFDKLLDKLPNIRMMYARGLHGNLETCHPPISVPAWSVMMTGKNPGKLGIYGFRHRRGFSYTDRYIVNSTTVKEQTVWEILSKFGKKSVIVGVPPGYPPKPVKDCNLVSCFLTPGINKDFAYPKELKEEILRFTGGNYLFDVVFRTEDREAIKKELFEMLEQKFDVAEYLAKNKPWDFFMMHEIGFDRLHHAFWKYFDPTHPKYARGNPYENVDLEYYKLADDRIGSMLDIFGDDCISFVLSDHGSKSMHGAFCINQWLEREGYLRFKTKPAKVSEFEQNEVDWSNTKAWGWGGYYVRIFFNVKGREPNGVIDPKDYETEKAKLTEKMLAIADHNGNKMKNVVLEPESLYGTAVGDRPDLMVYFDDLNWRSAGTVGHESLYLFENDTGPDDSVHSMNGIFLMYDPKRDLKGRELWGAKAQDIMPTLLEMYGVPFAADGIDGKVLREAL